VGVGLIFLFSISLVVGLIVVPVGIILAINNKTSEKMARYDISEARKDCEEIKKQIIEVKTRINNFHELNQFDHLSA
jgi:hypothetical protein